MSIKLIDGTFKAGTIVASDFAFVGTNAASFAAATTVTRISDKIVILSGIGPLLSASDDRVIIKAATLATIETNHFNVIVSDNYFNYSGDTITGYDVCGGITGIEIPSSLGGTPITKIGGTAFSGCSITSVIIPEGITSIGTMAFVDNNFATITIPSTVTHIDTWAFADNSLLTSVRFKCDASVLIDESSILMNNPLLITIIMDNPGLIIPDRFVTSAVNTAFRTAYESNGAGTYNYYSTDGSWKK